MLRNFVKIASRNILKHKFFSAINILGLAIGMACCLFIFIYVVDELSYDKFHADADRIYRIGLHGKIAGQEVYTTNSSYPVGETMTQEIPGVEEALRMLGRGDGVQLKNEDISFVEDGIFWADSNFFNFFSFKLLSGHPDEVLKEVNSLVLTPALARKYFGDDDPVGKILNVGIDGTAYKVTGVAEPSPSNSHFHYQAIASFRSRENNLYKGWTGNSLQTYVKLNPQTSVKTVNSQLEDIVAKYVGAELEQGLGINFEEFKKNGGMYSYYAYPLTNSHLYSEFPDDVEPGGDIKYVYTFSIIGLFILIIACINFMNLSTAKSAGRAKEVGLRKTLGSQRGQMVGQFLMESVIYGIMGVVLAVVICYGTLPYFNLLSGKELTLEAIQNVPFLIGAFALILLVGFIAGSYPAFYLTSFKAVEVLKGQVRAGMKSKGVRSSLVVVQFAISIFLIISTLVVLQQLTFMQEKDLGIDKHGVLIIENTSKMDNNMQAFKNAVKTIGGVEEASYTNNVFPGVNNTTVFREKGQNVDHLAGTYFSDYDHQRVLQFEIIDGRYFSRDFPSDSTAVVINEAAVREFGWDKPLGQEILDYSGAEPLTMNVIGVVKDFNFETLKSQVRPLVIKLGPGGSLLIRYTGNPSPIVGEAEKLWKQYAAGNPFEYNFLDQNFDSLFRAEQRLKNIFMVFAGLAIFIACLGLFALAAFTTEQRTKEIGIRKALGASVSSLTLLLSREFTMLVLIAFVPAAAAGWYFMNTWLEGFAYRIDVSPLVLILSGLIAIVIALVTVGYQSIKAAASNPISSLRYE